MSRLIRLASAGIGIALLATVVGIVAYDRGRDARQQRTVLYAGVRGVAVQAHPARYRLTLTPNTVVTLDRRPNCNGLTWRAISTK